MTTALPALEKARTPRITRVISRMALLTLAVTPFVLLLTPWQQSVHGTGKATAFNPVYRTQYLVSPIEGRVKKWHVVEGERVQRGQKIAELIDNDPLLESRLEQERQALVDRRQAAISRIQQIEVAISNLQQSFAISKNLQRTFVDIEQEQLNRAQQDKLDADAVTVAAVQNEDRLRLLLKQDSTAVRDVEQAVRDTRQAQAKLKSAEASIKLRKNALQAAQESIERIDKDMQTAVSRELAIRESAKAELASAETALVQIDVRIARQRAQYIESPVDGVVYRLLANAEMGGLLVRPGERLAMIVPDIKSDLPEFTPADMAIAGPGLVETLGELLVDRYPGIVAELLIDGNDLPLIRKGDGVRLQFEGWPAVQFVAIPEAATGTFAGRVFLVDPAANEKGQFRILVEPDPDAQRNPKTRWPREDYLRQGVQVQGWVLPSAPENRVTLGWELWRLLNGFPITRPVENSKAPAKLGPVSPVK